MSTRPASRTPSTGRSAARISPASIALVFIGGALGTLLRFACQHGTDLALTAVWGGPGSAAAHAAWVLPVNLLGAFLLALLYTSLPLPTLAAWAKSLLGTGLLGGFTSYSALALDVLSLSRDSWLWALGYIALSLAGGLVCAAMGAVLGHKLSAAPGLEQEGAR